MKSVFLILSLLFSLYCCGQNKIAEEINARISKGQKFSVYNLFTTGNAKSNQQLGGTYKALVLNNSSLRQFLTDAPAQFEITLEGQKSNYTLQLIRSFIIDENTKFIESGANGQHEILNYQPSLFYHGIIKGTSEKSFVAASISKTSGVHFFISYKKKNIQVGKINEKIDIGDYGNFENLPGNNEPFPFTCGTNEDEANVSPAINETQQKTESTEVYNAKVVRCFFDCSFGYYQQNGSSTANTFNRITSLFNEAALFYANDAINMAISEIRVWTTADPYEHDTRDNGLASFKNSVQNNYTGNLAMLCDWTATINSGLADGIGVLCQGYGNNDGPYIYNDLNYNNSFNNFPVAADAPDVYLICHEMGHITGSHHTHWCGWAGGAIDNCAAVEGSCPPGPTPISGTMMSYCCTNAAIGIDFNNGFGPQPAAAIHNHIIGSNCVGNGTGTCDSSLSLINGISNSDLTKFEVSNTLTARCVIYTGANVLFDAGKHIVLSPGFRAAQGCLLHAYIDGCGGNFASAQYTKSTKSSTINKETAEANTLANNLDIEVYPNPFTSSFELMITSDENKNAQIVIYNSLGVKVKEKPRVNLLKGLNDILFDGSNLSKGVYMIEINFGTSKTVKKIIKI